MKIIDLKKVGVSAAAAELCDVFCTPGAVALVPTETVYGLIARTDDKLAIERIFELKRRPSEKRLGWFAGDWRNLAEYGVILDGWPSRLAAEYCPGPLTIIAPCMNGSTLGFRVPDTPLLKEFLSGMPVPVVQTSANASGMPDASSCIEALQQLSGEVDCAVDGGSIEGTIMGSTVVDATGKTIKILRKGLIDLQKWL